MPGWALGPGGACASPHPPEEDKEEKQEEEEGEEDMEKPQIFHSRKNFKHLSKSGELCMKRRKP